jgi:hypothetical protein
MTHQSCVIELLGLQHLPVSKPFVQNRSTKNVDSTVREKPTPWLSHLARQNSGRPINTNQKRLADADPICAALLEISLIYQHGADLGVGDCKIALPLRVAGIDLGCPYLKARQPGEEP